MRKSKNKTFVLINEMKMNTSFFLDWVEKCVFVDDNLPVTSPTKHRTRRIICPKRATNFGHRHRGERRLLLNRLQIIHWREKDEPGILEPSFNNPSQLWLMINY